MSDYEPELSDQALLQAEARDVVEQLQLASTLTRAGSPVQLGSSVLGLMTWRDIDFHVYCDPLDPTICFEALRPVAGCEGLVRLTFSNRLGERRQRNEPEGYYSGIRYVHGAGNEWKIDVWFVKAQPVPSELEVMRQMRERLTPETQVAILRLKSLWHHSPSYRDTVTSMDIYEAVLDHGIDRPQEFESYLRRAGKL